MNTQAKQIKNAILVFCMTIIVVLMTTILVRFFVKNILIDKMEISDSLLHIIFYGSETVFLEEKVEEESFSSRTTVNWPELYPFDSKITDSPSENSTDNSDNLLSSFVITINKAEKKITNYSRDFLVGYQKLVEASNKYEECIGWNIATRTEYNGVVQLSDGFLTSYTDKRNVIASISAISSLYNFCMEHHSKFLYVQAPGKLCEYQDRDVYGRLDFSNQNADSLLNGLAKARIPYLDLRTELHKEYTNHHELFYKTDHHWKGQTGLWAAHTLAKQLNTKFEYDIPLEALEANAFDIVTYENWFLGSSGKKLTLSRIEPEDFELLYPSYPTSIQYQVQDKQIHEIGSFSITYDMKQLKKKDFYNLDPYAAYNHGNSALTKIHNNNCSSGDKILLIKDSFGNCMAPFLSLGLENLDIIDPRYFTGSIQNYIITEKPEMVIVMYYPDSISDSDNIELFSHTHLFDFQ